MPLDAARDGLIALQAQLIVVLAERNSALEARVGEMEERLARLERAVSRNSGFSELGLRLDSGWVRLVLPAGVSDGVDDEVEVGLVESGDGVTQDDR